MRFDEDTRGQSVLIGSILLFAILIVAFSSYQAFVVPSQNAEVEFNHNENVQSDMQDLRNSLLDVRSVERVGDEEYAIVSEHRPTRVRLGTRFPERLIALNPPAPSGTLRTVETSSPVEIQNADINETKEERFPNDVAALFEPHETAFLTYQPGYSEYQSAPNTVLEHSLLYNDHPETDLIVREQNVVNTSRKTINIVLFDGDFSRSSSRAVTLDPQTLDGPTAPVPIVPEDGENIRLRLPVESREAWDQSIDQTSGAEIIEAESSDEEVVIELEGDEYDLRMSKVGFDGGTKDNQFTPIQTKQAEPGGGGTATPAYDIFWEPGEMDSTDGFDCSQDECEILVGATEETKIGTTPETVAGFAEFAVLDGSIGEFPGGNTLPFDHTMRPITHDFQANEIGNTEIIVMAGDDRDELEIEVYGEGSLDGTVTDSSTDDGIGGAEVTITETGQEATTDGAGNYEITEIRTGTYDVTAEADGYQSQTAEGVVINHDETTTQDFALEQVEGEVGSFSGLVEDDGGDPIGETDVTFEADDGTFTETVETNADGTYTVEDIEEGTYDITASADGYEADTNTGVTIDAGEETENVDFILAEVSEFTVDIDEGASDLDVFESEDFNIVVDIENTGDTDLTQDVTAEVDGTERAIEESITLTGGETDQITLSFESQAADDDEDVTISSEDDSDTATLSVQQETTSELSNLDIAGQGDDATIIEGDDEDVSVDVENIGDLDETFDVTLQITDDADDVVLEQTESVSVDAGVTETVTFGSVTSGLDPGDYGVEVSTDDDSISGALTVDSPDANQIVLSDSGTSGGDGQSTISFGLQNTGDSDIDIVEISVDDTDTGALWVEREGGNTFEGAGGFFSGRIDIGAESEALEETATMSAGAIEEFDLGSFRDGTGGGGRINMNNQVATITLTFGDDSSAEYVLDTN